MADLDRSTLEGLRDKVDDLLWAMEKISLAEYIQLLRKPWHMVWVNFAAGLARGFGMAIGFTLLGALLIYLLQGAFLRNLPVIGGFIADIVRIVNSELK